MDFSLPFNLFPEPLKEEKEFLFSSIMCSSIEVDGSKEGYNFVRCEESFTFEADPFL